jgi:methylmalonyl-CoA/ethylmalonyl-CoA epimerase
MNAPLDRLAPYFFQIAYVVRDIAAAESWFQRLLGVPSWFRMNDMEFGEDCSFRGRPSDSAAHLSVGWLRDTQVELIEPLRGESLYREFLDEKGPGLHHVAFDVPDFDAAVGSLEASGLELLAKGRVGPGSEFAYFECAAEGASVVEILGFDAAIKGFMDQLRQKSAELVAEQRVE